MTKKMTIVGAGLVGSLWALMLRRRGFEVTVYERRSDPRQDLNDAGRSINLVITSRGLHALQRAGVLERAMELSVPVYGRAIHPIQGAIVEQPYGQEGECNHSISRASLNRFLLDEAERAGARFHFEHSLESLETEARALEFQTPQGPRSAAYEVLFGTDGAGSAVRKSLCRNHPERFQERTDWLEADYKELTLPSTADGAPALKPSALHIWARGAHMMMALANRDGSFTVTLYLPRTGSPVAFDHIRTKEDVRDLFLREFPDAIALMPNFQEEFLRHPQGALGTVRLNHWTQDGSIALMGDAAHAIVPFFGQGMNAGFEDCTALDDLLAAHAEDLPRALTEYERRRKPNADAIADMALENWIEMKEKVADPRFQLRKKLESALEQRHPGRYKSRYGMITYTLVPYAMALEAGRVQDALFNRLLEGKSDLSQVSWNEAEQLLESLWTPFVHSHGLDLSRFQV